VGTIGVEKRAMAGEEDDDCMILEVKEPAISWAQLKRPKLEAEEQPKKQLATPSSSTAPNSGGTQLNPTILVKE
jgi:hypothetical protein